MAENIYDNELFMKFISIILGLGLASLFRQACKGDKCVVIKGPKLQEIEKHIYKIDDKCYKYKPVPTMCS
tara:strand:+ start:93 stop:302 length:210 start_codon:yes stop_codon:yes gene_type:complete